MMSTSFVVVLLSRALAFTHVAPARRLQLRLDATHLVVFTGIEDMRCTDHPGIAKAADHDWSAVLLADASEEVMTSRQRLRRKAVDCAARDLDQELRRRYGGHLARTTDLETLLKDVDVAHVVDAVGVDRELLGHPKVETWEPPGLLSEEEEETFRFDESNALRKDAMLEPLPAPVSSTFFSLEEKKNEESRHDHDDGRGIVEPYAWVAVEKCGCLGGPAVVEEYLTVGRSEMSKRYLSDVNADSLYAAAQQWVVGDNDKASERLAVRETAERLIAPALAVGGLSKREVAMAARNKGARFPVPKWRDVARSDAGALLDVAEWRDWHDRIQKRKGAEDGTTKWWRWGSGGYMIRYKKWDGHDDDEKRALVLIHGFGASADQWTRLVDAIHKSGKKCGPIYAVDVVGFGLSAKPGLSYTQHLWESMLYEFVEDVVPEKVVLCGNSIGGGLAAGLAANLGQSKCAGLVLCNSAGVILDPDADKDLQESGTSMKAKTMAVLNGKEESLEPFVTPPGGQLLLDAFGQAVIEFLAPQIPKLLVRYYPTNPANADANLAETIGRDARDPGCANVIGSGAKLPPQRSLNEVLRDFGGPILVPQGEFDYVSGPERTRLRADQLATISGVPATVNLLESGHCPHDETPSLVGESIMRWLSKF